MSKLPEFLLVPFIPSRPGVKLIFHTKTTAYWQVMLFDSINDRAKWIGNIDLEELGAYAISMHKNYPYALLCTGAMNPSLQVESDKLIAIGNRASDWYASQWINERKSSRETPEDGHFKAFYICENRIEWEGQEAIIKLSFPRVFIRYNVGEAYFSSYEQFYQSIAVVEWLDGEKPNDPDKLQKVFTDCWNYLALEERKLEEDFDND